MPRVLPLYHITSHKYLYLRGRSAKPNCAIASSYTFRSPSPFPSRYRQLTSSRNMAPNLESYFKQYVEHDTDMWIFLQHSFTCSPNWFLYICCLHWCNNLFCVPSRVDSLSESFIERAYSISACLPPAYLKPRSEKSCCHTFRLCR